MLPFSLLCGSHSIYWYTGKRMKMYTILGELSPTFHIVAYKYCNPPTVVNMLGGEGATKYIQYLLWQGDLK